jgi:proline iminopeptidase
MASESDTPALANGSFTAVLGGPRIHYEVHGRGPVLMTLPNSWGLSLQGLRALYRRLEERLTLVYFDPRGMGGSGPAEEGADRGMAAVRTDFLALQRHLGLERVAAIGWSNGAMNLIGLAAAHPATLCAAVFVHGVANTAPEDMQYFEERHPDLVKAYGEFMADVARPELTRAERTERLRRFWLGFYFPRLCADRAAGTSLVARVFEDAELSWPHAERTNEEAAGFDARGDLARICVPSLVVAGAHDLLPPGRVREMADRIPGAEFAVFDRSGHFAPVEEPEAFADVVCDFLDRRTR